MSTTRLDFDRFLAEKEQDTKTITIFGRECEVPAELPWYYVMKVERMIRYKKPITGQENINLLRQMFKPDDFQFITHHAKFRASNVWELISFAWLTATKDEAKPSEPVFRTEDEVKIEETRAKNGSKNSESVR